METVQLRKVSKSTRVDNTLFITDLKFYIGEDILDGYNYLLGENEESIVAELIKKEGLYEQVKFNEEEKATNLKVKISNRANTSSELNISPEMVTEVTEEYIKVLDTYMYRNIFEYNINLHMAQLRLLIPDLFEQIV